MTATTSTKSKTTVRQALVQLDTAVDELHDLEVDIEAVYEKHIRALQDRANEKAKQVHALFEAAGVEEFTTSAGVNRLLRITQKGEVINAEIVQSTVSKRLWQQASVRVLDKVAFNSLRALGRIPQEVVDAAVSVKANKPFLKWGVVKDEVAK